MSPCAHVEPSAGSDHLIADMAIILTNLMAIFPAIVLPLKKYFGAAIFVAVGGGVSFVYHMCFKSLWCAGLDRARMDNLDFFFAANLAVVVAFVLNDGAATPSHPIYTRWRQWRTSIAVVSIVLLLLFALGDHHRTSMPIVGGALGLGTLFAFFIAHVIYDPALKEHYTRRAGGMIFAAVLLIGGFVLRSIKGVSFRVAHPLWHTVIFAFIGIVAVCVPPNPFAATGVGVPPSKGSNAV